MRVIIFVVGVLAAAFAILWALIFLVGGFAGAGPFALVYSALLWVSVYHMSRGLWLTNSHPAKASRRLNKAAWWATPLALFGIVNLSPLLPLFVVTLFILGKLLAREHDRRGVAEGADMANPSWMNGSRL